MTIPVVYGTPNCFSSGWPVAYLIAAVMMGIGLVVGSLIHVSEPAQVAFPSVAGGRDAGVGDATNSLASAVVARITGMVDCVWQGGSGLRVQGSGDADLPSAARARGAGGEAGLQLHTPIQLNDRLALRSGLLEITYDTGARVILQGPVTYKIDSAAGGYLSVGRLTARLEKKPSSLPSPASGRGAGGEGSEQQSTNGSRTQRQSALTLALALSRKRERGPDSPLFAITTPTAIVTDLGTEFGVEVSREMGTRVSVLQGRVSLRSSTSNPTIRNSDKVLLRQGQASQVDVQGKIVPQTADRNVDLAKTFIRRLPQHNDRDYVSLADLVAGGNGFGDRSFWGVNPRDASVLLAPNTETIESSGRYERYAGYPQIDGAFIPNGERGPVQVDSVGHRFAFPKTSGTSCNWGIWSYHGVMWNEPTREKPACPADAQNHPMMCIHGNAGITFDLSAIRKSADSRRPIRFVTTVYDPQWRIDDHFASAVTDLWVLVDGQLRFGKTRLSRKEAPAKVDVLLNPNDRFLTLVITDGGDPGDIAFDCVCLFEPRVLLETAGYGGGP